MGKVYKLKIFIQVHRKQQKDGFYLFVVVEVTSLQINIIHKQHKCCQYICFYIAFINFTHRKKMTLNVSFFLLYKCYYKSDGLIIAKKRISYHINKVAQAFILPPPPIFFLAFSMNMLSFCLC